MYVGLLTGAEIDLVLLLDDARSLYFRRYVNDTLTLFYGQ